MAGQANQAAVSRASSIKRWCVEGGPFEKPCRMAAINNHNILHMPPREEQEVEATKKPIHNCGVGVEAANDLAEYFELGSINLLIGVVTLSPCPRLGRNIELGAKCKFRIHKVIFGRPANEVLSALL